jgi:hypothetical protein
VNAGHSARFRPPGGAPVLFPFLLLSLWVALNAVAWVEQWDASLFLLLNLAVLFILALSAPAADPPALRGRVGQRLTPAVPARWSLPAAPGASTTVSERRGA